MLIKNWKIEGFKSISQPLLVEVQEGITLFSGENGSGKTTIIEALRWGLFGNDFQSSKKEDLISRPLNRHKEFQGTKVSVEFSVKGIDYSIHRCLSFKGEVEGITGGDSVLLVEAGELSQLRSIKDVQARIIEIIGISPETFELLIAIPQYGTSFMTLSNSDKVGLLNTLFGFAWVDEAKEKAKLSQGKFLDSIQTLEADLLKVDRSLDILKVKQQSQADQERHFNTSKAIQVEDLLKRVFEYKQKLAELEKEQENWELEVHNHPFNEDLYKSDLSTEKEISRNLESLISSNLTIKAKHTLNLKEQERLIESIRNRPEIKELCNNCGGKLSENKISELKQREAEQVAALKEKLTQLEAEASQIKEVIINDGFAIETLKKEREAVNQRLFTHMNLQSDLKALKAKPYSPEAAEWLKNEIIKTQEKAKSVDASSFDKQDYSKDIEEKEGEQERCITWLTEQKEQLEKVTYWVSKGFGDRGLKAFLTKRVLDSIDAILAQYSAIIGWGIEVTMIDSASKQLQVNVFDSNNICVPFKTLSGGERRRVELAITFALHEVLTSLTADINLMFLDEPFHHLDEEGSSKVMELLRTKNKSLYITSHTNLDLVGVRVLNVKKDKFTIIE